MIYNVKAYNIIPYDIMTYNIIPYDIMSYDVMTYEVMTYDKIRYVILIYNIMAYYAIPYDAMSYDVMTYDVMIQGVHKRMRRSFCLIFLPINFLEHLSTKTFLYNIRERRYREINTGYQFWRIWNNEQSIISKSVSAGIYA